MKNHSLRVAVSVAVDGLFNTFLISERIVARDASVFMNAIHLAGVSANVLRIVVAITAITYGEIE